MLASTTGPTLETELRVHLEHPPNHLFAANAWLGVPADYWYSGRTPGRTLAVLLWAGIAGRSATSRPAARGRQGRDSREERPDHRAQEARAAGRPTTRPGHHRLQGSNVVERSFARNKQWRAIATRYDELAITYRAAAVLHACLTWI